MTIRTKLKITGGAVLALVLFLWLIMPLFFNTEPAEQKLLEYAQSTTDLELKINGDKSLSIFPLPAFTVENVDVIKEGKQIGTVEEIEVRLSFFRLFAGDLKPKKLVLVAPELTEGVNLNISKEYSKLPDNSDKLDKLEIEVENGVYKINSYKKISNINAKIIPYKMKAEGSLSYDNEDFKFAISAPKNTAKSNLLEANIEHNLIKIDIAGTFDDNFYNDFKNLKLEGAVTIELKNTSGLIKRFIQNTEILDHYQIQEKITFEGNFNYSPRKLELDELYGDFHNEQLGLSIDYPFVDKETNPIAISVAIDELNLDKMVKEGVNEPILPKIKSLEIPDDIFLSLDFAIKNFIINGHSIDIQKLRGDIIGGEIILQPSIFTLPGNNNFTVFGMLGNEISTIDRERKNYRFAGKVEIEGDDLKKLFQLTDYDPFAKIPESSLKKFSLTADIFMTGKEFRVSNIIMKFDETELLGAVIGEIKNTPIIEAAIRARNINIDNYLPEKMVLFKSQVEKGEEYKIKDEINSFSWIERNKWKTKLNLKLKNISFQDRFFEQLALAASLEDNVLRLREIDINSKELSLLGNANIIVKDDFPQINGILKFTDINTADFFDVPREKSPLIKTENWSTAPFDFGYLAKFNSKFELEFNSLTHHGYILNNLKASGNIENEALDVENLTANIFEGDLDANFELSIRNVPSLVFNFELANIDTYKFMNWLSGTDNMTGRMSINGNLKTSGLNRKSWSEQLDGALSLLSKPFIVEGFELPVIVRKVSNLRTVADIINISRLALRSGKTKFNQFRGNMIISQGKVSAPKKLKLKSNFTDGEVFFKFNVYDKKIDILSQFGLDVRFCDAPALLKVRMLGKLGDMERIVDTKYLENYVAKCEALRMIKQ